MKKLIALALLSSSAWAYEVETHGLLTVEAYKLSVLGPTIANPLYINLGFDRVDAQNPYLQPNLADCASSGSDRSKPPILTRLARG
jgi:hypothetical protein